jgi:outer membrane protein TolC
MLPGSGSVNGGAQPSLPMTNDWTWSLALNVSIPIIDQGQRIIDLQRTNIQQRQLDLQQRNLDQSVELGIRSLVLDLVSASTNVKNSRIAAENTQKNYEAVQDGYQKGVVPINQLIDAQDAAFSTRQNYENSVYNYLLTFLELENILGRYTILSGKEENQAFMNRYLQYIEKNKIP